GGRYLKLLCAFNRNRNHRRGCWLAGWSCVAVVSFQVARYIPSVEREGYLLIPRARDLTAGRNRRLVKHQCACTACKHRQRFQRHAAQDRKSTRLNSSHLVISYAVFCLKKKKKT